MGKDRYRIYRMMYINKPCNFSTSPASSAGASQSKGENATNTIVLEEQVQEMPQNPGFFGHMPYITM